MARAKDQIALPGFGNAAPSDRLLLLIYPDPVMAARIAGLAEPLRRAEGLTGAAVAADRLHITLHHLGEYDGVPKHIAATASEAMAKVDFPAFPVVFDRIHYFRRPRNQPIILRGDDGLNDLVAFQQVLGTALARHGLGKLVDRHFTPHVTLLYDDRDIAERAAEPIRWTVREFALVHSLLGQTRHVTLARWSLAE